MKTIQFIGAYWYNRPQDLTQCVHQLEAFLIELNHHNAQLYGNWFEKAHSKKAALLKPVQIDYSSIRKAFPEKATETSFPETSFRVGFWNGAESEEAVIEMSVSLGSSETKSFTNNCLIRFGENKACQAFYADKANTAALELLFRRIWKPERLVIE